MRVCLIPAAGASSRMRGGDKLLEDVGGAPCLQVLARRALQTDAEVLVTVPSLDHPRAATLAGSGALLVAVADAHLGMSRSLVSGIAQVPTRASGVMILPGDMPDITADDMSTLWRAFEDQRPVALRAVTDQGLPGHPTIFSPALFADFAQLTGDTGAVQILKAQAGDVVQVALEGRRARLDLDTPEDWAAWRAQKI